MLRQLRSRRLMKRIMIVTLCLVVPSFVAFYGWTSGKNQGRGGIDEWLARLQSPRWYGSGWDYIRRSDDWELRSASNSLENAIAYKLSLEGRIGRDQLADRRLIRQLSSDPRDIASEAIDLRLTDLEASRQQVRIGADEMRATIASQIRRLVQGDPQLAQNYTTPQIWEMWLRREGMNQSSYVARQTRDRRRVAVRSSIGDEALPSLSEIWEQWTAIEEKIGAEWVTFRVRDFEDAVELSEEQLATFFEENTGVYAFPDRREYSFVVVERDDLSVVVAATTEALRAYYDEHLDDFLDEATVQPRFIKIVPSDVDVPSTQALQAFRDKIATVEDALATTGADFAAIADAHTEEITNIIPGAHMGKRGGLMPGVVTASMTSKHGPQFDTVALALAEGETTGPIYTDQGAFFIRADTVTPETPRPFEFCRTDIEFRIKGEFLDERFAEEKERFRTENERQTTMASLAAAMGVELIEGAIADKGSVAIPGLPSSLWGEEETLADMDRDEPKSPVISTTGFHVVLKVEEEIKARLALLDEVTTDVRRHLTTLEAAKAALAAAEEFAVKARAEEADIAALAADIDSEDAYTSAAFTRGRPFAKEGTFSTTSFENFDVLSRDLTTGTVRIARGVNAYFKVAGEQAPSEYVVWKVAALDSPDRVDFIKELPRTLPMFAAYEQMAIFDAWLSDKRREAQFELGEALR